ncbi:arginase family protein, partial [Streptomyces sp. NPDC004561]
GTADVAVVGVPFDSGVSYRPGARFGGNAIREELTGKMTESGAHGKAKGALSGAAETVSEAFKQARDEGQERQGERAARRGGE